MDNTFDIIASEPQQDSVELVVSGRFDAHGADIFDRRMERVAEAKPARITVDMQGVTYISSAGLRSLLRLLKLASPIGAMVAFRNPQIQVQKVFDTTDLPGFRQALERGKDELGFQAG